MYSRSRIRPFMALAALVLPSLSPAAAQEGPVGVYTYHNDNHRTGWNRHEVQLTHATVTPDRFGKLWSRPVDGQVYAQPLYAPALNMGAAGTRNVVFVATEHNSVYAFDADTGGSAPLWQRSLGPSVPIAEIVTRDPGDPNTERRPCPDIEGPEYGITGSPVIDPATQTLYVVAKTSVNQQQIYRLHALDVRTGQEREGWPVEIRGSVAGDGGGSVNGQIAFDPFLHLQRAGLLLLNGRVIIAFGAHCDFKINRYHGWLFSYNTANPAATPHIFNSTPENSLGAFLEAAGGIWQGGFGPAADDAGNIYIETGNGLFNADLGGPNVGDSFVKLSTAGGTLSFTPDPANFYTPNNERELDRQDLDLGSGGAMVIPDQTGTSTPRLVIGAGKDGVIRLLNRDFLGGHNGRASSTRRGLDEAVHQFRLSGFAFGGPAYWEGPSGSTIFYTANGDRLRQLRLGPHPDGSGRSGLTQSAQSTLRFAGHPCPTPVVSSSGRTAGTGIVWVLRRDDNSLRAFNAEDVTKPLWDSRQIAENRLDGNVVKFTVPIVANGKVYAATKTHRKSPLLFLAIGSHAASAAVEEMALWLRRWPSGCRTYSWHPQWPRHRSHQGGIRLAPLSATMTLTVGNYNQLGTAGYKPDTLVRWPNADAVGSASHADLSAVVPDIVCYGVR
jgi:outer membrane protein assembly factor BamB